MIQRALNLMARTEFQKLWWALYRISIGGLGFMNAAPRFNGEERFAREYCNSWEAAHPSNKPIIFDVGANEGDFTVAFLGQLEKLEIHCFEPNPNTYARLSQRLGQDQRVHLNQAGVANVAGTLTLYDYDGSEGTGHASFLRETFDDIYPAATQEVRCDLITIDEYVEDHNIKKIDLLKIDVEGFEREVLEGAKRTIEAGLIETIQLEFNAHNLINGFSILKLSHVLSGFDIFRIVANGLTPVVTREHAYNSRVEIFKYSNLIAQRRR